MGNSKYHLYSHALTSRKNVKRSTPSKSEVLDSKVKLESFDDYFWHGSIAVNGKLYIVNFDTGSADLLLAGPGCTFNDLELGRPLYDPETSTTKNDLQRTFSVTYGDDASVSGDVYTDTVQIAGLTVVEQGIGVANVMTGIEDVLDGIVGMGFPPLSRTHQLPLFQNLLAQGLITSSVFAFRLGARGCPSELTLGSTNPKWHIGDFHAVPVIQMMYWKIRMNAVVVDGQIRVSPVDAVVDTGSALVLGDITRVAELYAAIPGSARAPAQYGAGVYTFPCKKVPRIGLNFNGRTFEFLPDSLNMGPLFQGSENCRSAIGISPMNTGFWIIGDAFLNGVYTKFDADPENPQVGFAELSDASLKCPAS